MSVSNTNSIPTEPTLYDEVVQSLGNGASWVKDTYNKYSPKISEKAHKIFASVDKTCSKHLDPLADRVKARADQFSIEHPNLKSTIKKVVLCAALCLAFQGFQTMVFGVIAGAIFNGNLKGLSDRIQDCWNRQSSFVKLLTVASGTYLAFKAAPILGAGLIITGATFAIGTMIGRLAAERFPTISSVTEKATAA